MVCCQLYDQEKNVAGGYMKYRKIASTYVVRIDRGEEIISQLKKVCEENQIRLGRISGIGAVNKAVVGFFDSQEKKYHSRLLSGDHEITSLLGNITTMDQSIYLHCHINLADAGQQTFSGHLNEGWVSATCEVIIEQFDGEINRRYDETSGLNLLDL